MKDRLRALWRRALRWLKPPRMLLFTRLGTYVVLLALGIGLAAMNTGNNLVYLLFGMMLGLITASGVLSEISLRRLEADWILPAEIFAGRRQTVRLILHNAKRSLPSFGVDVEVRLRTGTGQTLTIAGYFPFLPAGAQTFRDLALTPPRRGNYRIEEVKIETRFPFGFFRKYLVRSFDENFLVYPKVAPLPPSEPDAPTEPGPGARPLRGWGQDFWGLREFTHGDSPRLISWKTSAKRAKWVVRENEREREKALVLAPGGPGPWLQLSDDKMEEAVAFAASFAWEAFERGFALGWSDPVLNLRPFPNRKNLEAILARLATFEPSGLTPAASEARGAVDVLALWRASEPA